MRSTQNPFARLARDTERRAALAAVTPQQQAAAGVAQTGGGSQAGDIDGAGAWAGYGMADLTLLLNFPAAP